MTRLLLLIIFRRGKDQNALFHQQKTVRVEFRVIIPSQFGYDKSDGVYIEFGVHALGYWKSDYWKMTRDR